MGQIQRKRNKPTEMQLLELEPVITGYAQEMLQCANKTAEKSASKETCTKVFSDH